jgi:hypothetical protein
MRHNLKNHIHKLLNNEETFDDLDVLKSPTWIWAKNVRILKHCLQFVTFIGLQPLHCNHT